MRWSEILPPAAVHIGDSLFARAAQERAAGALIYPKQQDIFKALSITTPDRLKVCIIGQDPYHTIHAANGLAFSVNPGVRIPPSLENIFSELEYDLGIPHPENGDLTAWAKRGVLLLNTSLTVYHHQANSHADWGWQGFTKSIFLTALELPQPIVFILWGRHAQSFADGIDINSYPDKACIMSSHPSPFSAHKATKTMPAFNHSRPFSRANDLLIRMGSDPVDWRL